MAKSPAANPAAGAGCAAGVKVHSEAGVCVELPARSGGRLESRFPDSALSGQVAGRPREVAAGQGVLSRDETGHWGTILDKIPVLW